MSLIAISLGSNVGDRLCLLEKAVLAISEDVGTIIKQSEIYETQSWGYQGGNFLNMAVLVKTEAFPQTVLQTLLEIERRLGRVRGTKTYSDRSIDLDILFYGTEIVKLPELEIPHPRIPERLFVLYPLIDIYPEWIHPILHKTIHEMVTECNDQCWIQPYGEPK